MNRYFKLTVILILGLLVNLPGTEKKSFKDLKAAFVSIISTGEESTAKRAVQLAADGNSLIHIIASDPKEVAQINEEISAAGLNGLISAEALKIKKLPYRDFLVNNLIIMDMAKARKAGFTMAEAKRCVAPLGKIVSCNAGEITKVEDIPMLSGMDDWTHRYQAADGLGVSKDKHFALPLGYKWNAGLARGFKDPQGGTPSNGSVRSFLAANGRIYSLSTTVIENLGDSYKTKYGKDMYLTCRDAFNGRFYWRKKIGFMNYGGGYVSKIENSAPMAVSGKYIYVPINKSAVLKVDGVSGKILQEISTVFNPGVLVTAEGVVVVASWKHEEVGPKFMRSLWDWQVQDGVIEAFDVETNKRLWKQEILAKSVLVKDGRVFIAEVQTKDEPGSQKVARKETGIKKDTSIDSDDPKDKNKEHPDYWVKALDLRKGNTLWQEQIKDARGFKGGSLTLEGVAENLLLVIVNRHKAQLRNTKTGKAVEQNLKTAGFFRYKGGGCVPTFRVNDISLGNKYMSFEKDGEKTFFDGARAACVTGTIPAYGAGYVTQNWCGCSAAMIPGMIALGPIGKIPTTDEMKATSEPKIHSHYDEATDGINSKSTWTTYRGNSARNSSSKSQISLTPKETWMSQVSLAPANGTVSADWKPLLKSKLTAAVLSDKLVIVADIDRHEIIATKLSDGSTAWRFLTGGRIDVAPTLYKGICFTADRTGKVYALKINTGELLYTLRIAPQDKRMVSHGKVESVWPILGGVLVHNDKAYAAAGRSEGSDGGIVVRAFTPETGKQIWAQTVIQKGGWESRPNDTLLVDNGKLRLTENYMDLETGARVKSARIDYLLKLYPEEATEIEELKDKYAAAVWGEKRPFKSSYAKINGALKKKPMPGAPKEIKMGLEGLSDNFWRHVGSRRFKSIGIEGADGCVSSWSFNGAAWVTIPHSRHANSLKNMLKYKTAGGSQNEIDMTYKLQATSIIFCENAVLTGGYIAERETRNTGKKGFIQILDTATGKITFKKEYDAQLAFNGLAVNDGQIVATFNDGSVVLMK